MGGITVFSSFALVRVLVVVLRDFGVLEVLPSVINHFQMLCIAFS